MPWAHLGPCDWATFEAKTGADFQDSNHILKMQTSLQDLKLRASVSKHNDKFRALILEVMAAISR